MAQTAIEIIQRVVRLLPVTTPPTTIVGTTDPQVTNLVAILNDVGQEIASRHDWSALGSTFSFVSTNSDYQAVPFPSTYASTFPNASVWRSGSLLTPLSGPTAPDIWHRLRAMPGLRYTGYWRFFNGNLEIIGAPIGETVSIEFVSNTWVIDADSGVRKDEVAKDADRFLFGDRLLRLGCIWNWRSNRGLSYAEEMASFEKQLESDIAADRAARPMSLSMPPAYDSPHLSWPGIVMVAP